MQLCAPADRDALLADLADFYGVHPRIFKDMADATLERAWRVTRLHEQWTNP